MSEVRTITVRCTWESEHRIEVPASTPPIGSSDMEAVLEHEDVDASGASLTDWEILDNG